MPDTTITSLTRGSRLPSLRAVLLFDAVLTAANGAAYLVAAAPLGDLLGLSPSLLRGAGAFLLAFSGIVALAARTERPAHAAVVAIVAVNALWALESLVAAAAGWGGPATAGTVWICLQAAVVGTLALLQGLALRARSAP